MDVFAVRDLGKIDIVRKAIAVFNGSAMCTASFLLNGGTDGAMVKFQCAVTIEKYVYISPRARTANPAFVRCLEHFMSLPGSRWNKLRTMTEWYAKTRHQPKNASRYIAIVTQEEKNSAPGLATMKFCQTAELFLQCVATIDPMQSRIGIAGR